MSSCVDLIAALPLTAADSTPGWVEQPGCGLLGQFRRRRPKGEDLAQSEVTQRSELLVRARTGRTIHHLAPRRGRDGLGQGAAMTRAGVELIERGLEVAPPLLNNARHDQPQPQRIDDLRIPTGARPNH